MNKIKILFSIVERGKGKELIELLNARGIRFHLQTVGHGTAPSEMKDIFGLVNSEKDVVISLASERALASFAAEQGQVVGKNTHYGGLTMITRLTAIGRVTAEILERGVALEKGGKRKVDNERKYEMIFISVNQGYSEEVMKTAKKAGATGGTVMRGRLAGLERLDGYGDEEASEEREIISILAPVASRKEIMESVNAEFGLSTKAKGTVCAVPVEKAFKI
ncbi:MAG: hypothetical protein IJX81_03705 [Clostridia bacterium]|nr:hypothetical protein [Clostridia bacterium]